MGSSMAMGRVVTRQSIEIPATVSSHGFRKKTRQSGSTGGSPPITDTDPAAMAANATGQQCHQSIGLLYTTSSWETTARVKNGPLGRTSKTICYYRLLCHVISIKSEKAFQGAALCSVCHGENRSKTQLQSLRRS